ncbi:putative spermidine/putrescine transport system substrate-binding protein [Kitasatospora sp. MAP12-15]|uniref:ABC transporter substrate-binding protein n=1 Tax=unclassified Kitasatospora TaxID=2633591 RepID=UPI0024735F74|nr:ABC transporter substrate-binding protein [Kitasatospora sp. MAP12-44]MDH6113420.1 putative spermidine/putrescine transport system substrate-binding protein [Kitasatospora sp. MAP12-44]
MTTHRARTAAFAAVLTAAALSLSACGSAGTASTAGASGGAKDAKTATSAADFGGMDALVAAAKKEGTLNAITLPRDWANYGAIMDAFTAKYGIKIQDENPDGSSQDEINAITSRKDQDRAPDVVDLGSAFALSAASQGLLAPYKVTGFDQIPDSMKDATGLSYNDYGGYMSIGCDAKKVAVCPKNFSDLLNPAYKGMVALNGDPTKAGAAFGAVYAAALANGGSLDNIQPGIDFFGKLKKAGNFNPVEVTPATIQKGETPISVDWSYLNAGYTDKFASQGIQWQVSIPSDGSYAQYYNQAINKWAPHPAAARLWEEYLYSADGQNGFLKGYATPALFDAMKTAGTLDPTAVSKLPTVTKPFTTFPTQAQTDAAKKVVTQNWAAAIAG